MNPESSLSIYVHIPFCLKKCGYCDFHSVAMRPEDIPQREYALAVCEELHRLAARYELHGRRVGTIYFGGGTPTVFEPANLNIILDAIYKDFAVASDAEVSIEANPETISPSPKGEKPRLGPAPFRGRWSGVRGLLETGFNRISIGIQSFNDKLLRALGRIHDADTARRAVHAAQEAGFKNVGIDLMWGLPGQTLAGLEQDIDNALALGVQHISAYQLTMDHRPLTPVPLPLGERGDHRLPSEELAKSMFLLVHNKLTSARYEHYEISNFARAGAGSDPAAAKALQNASLSEKAMTGSDPCFHCRHNLNYWRYGEWLGVGCSATSQISNFKFQISDFRCRIPTRFTSNKNIGDYLVHGFQYKFDEITSNEAIAEYCFMNLRTSDGIDLNDFKHRFGREFDEIYPHLREKWISNNWAAIKHSYTSTLLYLNTSAWLISDELFRELV